MEALCNIIIGQSIALKVELYQNYSGTVLHIYVFAVNGTRVGTLLLVKLKGTKSISIIQYNTIQ